VLKVAQLYERTKRVSRICSFSISVTLILQYDVESVNDARNVTCWGCVRKRACQGCFGATRQLTKYCEKDVYQKVGATATLQKDTERREDNGEDDLDDVAA
jgi:hypothetical protein